MKIYTGILLYSVAVLIYGCTKADDPEYIDIQKIYFYAEGSQQQGFADTFLTDSIGIVAYDEINGRYVKGLKVVIENIQGGGQVEETSGYTDSRGKFTTRWKLGNGGYEQALTVKIYNEEGLLRGTLNILSYSIVRNGWNHFKSSSLTNFTSLINDTANGITLAVISASIYRRSEDFFKWDQVSDYNIGPINELLQGYNGFYFANTFEGRLYRSSNPAAAWMQSTNPYNCAGGFKLNVSRGNILWASRYGDRMLFSDDMGLSWNDDVIGLDSVETGEIFLISDGTLLLRSTNLKLYKSEDNGHTWTPAGGPQFILKLYVTENDEIIVFNGSGSYLEINKSTDGGRTFTLMNSVQAGQSTMYHTVHMWQGSYYLLIPNYGILKTNDFVTFSTFWYNTDAMDMLMDADGNIIVTTYTWQNNGIYYLDNPL